MNISIDSILGSAKKINNQRNSDNIEKRQKATSSAADKIEISTKVNSRLDSIGQDLKKVQHSLTRNQIIQNGLEQAEKEIQNGSQNLSGLYNDVTYNDQKILLEFLDGKDTIDLAMLNNKKQENEKMLKEDINSLTRLQVETENILASNLGSSDKFESTLKKLENSFQESNANSVNNISNLNADVVMKLIK